MKSSWFVPLLFAVASFAGSSKVVTYAPVPPPPARVEKRGLPPGPGNVWINGYWGFDADRHVWHDGHWEKPPRTNAHYIEPRWDRKGDRYAFREGRWK